MAQNWCDLRKSQEEWKSDKIDVSTKGKLPSPLRSEGCDGVSQSSENDAQSEMVKKYLSTEALSAVRR